MLSLPGEEDLASFQAKDRFGDGRIEAPNDIDNEDQEIAKRKYFAMSQNVSLERISEEGSMAET